MGTIYNKYKFFYTISYVLKSKTFALTYTEYISLKLKLNLCVNCVWIT